MPPEPFQGEYERSIAPRKRGFEELSPTEADDRASSRSFSLPPIGSEPPEGVPSPEYHTGPRYHKANSLYHLPEEIRRRIWGFVRVPGLKEAKLVWHRSPVFATKQLDPQIRCVAALTTALPALWEEISSELLASPAGLHLVAYSGFRDARNNSQDGPATQCDGFTRVQVVQDWIEPLLGFRPFCPWVRYLRLDLTDHQRAGREVGFKIRYLNDLLAVFPGLEALDLRIGVDLRDKLWRSKSKSWPFTQVLKDFYDHEDYYPLRKEVLSDDGRSLTLEVLYPTGTTWSKSISLSRAVYFLGKRRDLYEAWPEEIDMRDFLPRNVERHGEYRTTRKMTLMISVIFSNVEKLRAMGASPVRYFTCGISLWNAVSHAKRRQATKMADQKTWLTDDWSCPQGIDFIWIGVAVVSLDHW